MSYQDKFGSRTQFIDRSSDDDEASKNRTSIIDAAKDTTVKKEDKPLLFEGFGSGLPLLLEKPSSYINRLTLAARSMFKIPNGEDPETRVLFSPIVPFPFFILDGTEMFASEDALKYPLLHAPSNHMPDDPATLDVYALTLYVMYSINGMIAEDSDGSLFAYAVEGDFEVADDVWEASAEWAKDTAPILRELNLARLAGFASTLWNEERPYLEVLEDTWNIKPEEWQELSDKAPQNADLLSSDYDIITDIPFLPFEEGIQPEQESEQPQQQ